MLERCSLATLRRKPRVYIAHPINQGDMLANIRHAIIVWRQMVYAGYNPFCPGAVDLGVRIATQGLEYDEWMDQDYPWLDLCDALLRLPGKSVGAPREVRRANKLGIPVFYSWAALEKWKNEVFLTGRKSIIPKATPVSRYKKAVKSRRSNGKSTKKKGQR